MALQDTMQMQFPSNFWHGANQPLDAKTIFDTLEQACGDNTTSNSGELGTLGRFKGQKFIVKNIIDADGNNIGPKEYWFIEDYQAPDLTKVWVFNPDNEFKDFVGLSKAEMQTKFGENANQIRDRLKAILDNLGIVVVGNWSQIWQQATDPIYFANKLSEIIPEPVLYQPGGSGGVDINTDELTGDKLKAEAIDKGNPELNTKGEQLYRNREGEPLTINEYADRQPFYFSIN